MYASFPLKHLLCVTYYNCIGKVILIDKHNYKMEGLLKATIQWCSRFKVRKGLGNHSNAGLNCRRVSFANMKIDEKFVFCPKITENDNIICHEKTETLWMLAKCFKVLANLIYELHKFIRKSLWIWLTRCEWKDNTTNT